jgi:sorbitol-specific phosphotransferase system component IIBC
MVLFGIFKRKKKGNQTPNNEHVPVINSTVTSHSEASHLTESKYTSTTAKKATVLAANTSIAATNLTSSYSQQSQKAVRDKQKPLQENDLNVLYTFAYVMFNFFIAMALRNVCGISDLSPVENTYLLLYR